jgi:hypothetical protein
VLMLRSTVERLPPTPSKTQLQQANAVHEMLRTRVLWFQRWSKRRFGQR